MRKRNLIEKNTGIFSSSSKAVSLVAILVLLLVLSFTFLLHSQRQHRGHAAGTPLAIHVVGNHLVNGQGQAIRLIGVNFPAGVSCVAVGHTAPGIFMAPSTTQAAAAMANWHINVVRITINEDCWLGINGVNPAYSGSNYQNAIISFVNLLHTYNMYAIVDLHVNAPGTMVATSQQVMADTDHAFTYWQSLANTFKNDPAVIFQAYNEPHITTSNAQTTNPWQCWRDGCTITTLYANGNQIVSITTPWQGAGEQSLVNAIRSTGATNPIMLGGLNWSQDLSQFLHYLPSDPQHQLVASYHNYMGAGSRNTLTYWNTVIAPIAQQMPVVTDEFGEKDCQSTYVNQYMNWADAHNVSYLPWVWSTWQCSAYGLLANWNGTPNTYGQTFYNHFRAINPISSTPTPIMTASPTPTSSPIPVPKFALLIDAGGPGGIGYDGEHWLADTGYIGGRTVNRGAIPIANTDNPWLYRTERYGMSGYVFSVPNGTYQVNLYFAETFSAITGPGQRVFSVDVQGEKLNHLDIFKETGGRDIALVEQFFVTVSNGKLAITFIKEVQQPEINAIEILQQ